MSTIYRKLASPFLRSLVSQSQAQGRFIQPMMAGRGMSTDSYSFETLQVTQPRDFVFHVEINRPDKMNAMNQRFWKDMHACFTRLSTEQDCRAVLVSAVGKIFTAGIDLTDLGSIAGVALNPDLDAARKAHAIRDKLRELQEGFSVLEKCPKPVIGAIHGACVGAGVDLITACDIRHCTSDAWFSVKEVDVGLAADLGTLQRLPKVLGNDSLARELVYTARRLPAAEARDAGLVSRVFEDKESMIAGGLDLASEIAEKSPVAVQASKMSLVFSRDHSVPEGLDHINQINQVMLQSEDLMNAAAAAITKEKATFSKL